jgi:O-antigen ligase
MPKPPKTLPVESGLAEIVTTWLARVLLIALLLYSPWNYGMVTWGEQVKLLYWVMGIGVSTLIAVLLRKAPCPKPNFFTLALLVILAIGVCQICPLPQTAFNNIAPIKSFEQAAITHAKDHLTLDPSLIAEVSQGEGFSETTISIHPVQSRGSLAIFACAIIVLLSSTVLFNDKPGQVALLISVCCVSSSIAILGILQSISWNSWTLLPMPTSSYFSTFVSRNSAPQYLAAGIGSTFALIGIMKRRKDKRAKKNYQRRYPATTVLAKVRQALEDTLLEFDAVMLVLFTVLVAHIVAVVAAASRGGMLALLFSIAVSLLYFLATNRRWIVAGVAGFVTVAIAATIALDKFELYEEMSDRMQDLGSQGRLDLWASSLRLSQYWFTGSGMGTYRFAIMPENPMQNKWPLHAESIYVELAVEFGIIGLVIASAGVLWLLLRLFPSDENKNRRMWPAAIYCILAVLLQSSVDFSLIIPAVFLGQAVLIGAFLGEVVENKPYPTEELSSLGSKVKFAFAIILLLVVGWNGRSSILGFAQAEKIARWYKSAEPQTPKSLDSKDPRLQEFPLENLDFSHPEVVLELSRGRLLELERLVRSLPNWPKTLSEPERRQLSNAELISAVIRSSPASPEWEARKAFYLSFPWITERLKACNAGFQFASKSCRLDWRAAWGRFQSQTQKTPAPDIINWSRLNLVSRTVFNMQEVMGTCCIIAGEREMGIKSWKDAIVGDPKRASSLSGMLGVLLNADDVLSILPDNPIAKAQLCRAMFSRESGKSIAADLLENLNSERLIEAARDSSDWELVAWLSDKRDDQEGLAVALSKLADLRPFDVQIRYQLALVYEKLGRIPEAIKQLEQAARRANLPVQVQNYLSELRKLN